MSGDPLRSGQLADAAGVNLQTLRYYERRGLLEEPRRTLGGHRLYLPESLTVLRVIKTAQRLGFTLDEVADLVDLGRHRHGHHLAGLQARAAAKLTEIDRRIADLQDIAATLRDGDRRRLRRPHHLCRQRLLPVAVRAPRPRRHLMSRQAALLRRLLPTSLGSLAGVACAACCLLPVLLAAGVLGGAGWAGAARFLPGVAVALAAAAGLAWWWTRRRSAHTAGCAGGSCFCPSS